MSEGDEDRSDSPPSEESDQSGADGSDSVSTGPDPEHEHDAAADAASEESSTSTDGAPSERGDETADADATGVDDQTEADEQATETGTDANQTDDEVTEEFAALHERLSAGDGTGDGEGGDDESETDTSAEATDSEDERDSPSVEAGEEEPGAETEVQTPPDEAGSSAPYSYGESETAASAEGAETDDASTAASDGGTVTGDGAGIGGEPSYVDEYEDDDDWLRDGPEYDQEMPLADHIEEMVQRILVVVVVMAVVSVPTFLFADQLINFIWNSILGAAGSQADPHVYSPLALILARLKTATLVGFVIGLPVFVYETYLFMRPGLYPRERRYYLAAVPTSLVLAAIGVSFAFYLVLPGIFIYFLYYSQDVAFIAFGLSDTYGLMLLLMGFFAVIFQIPLFIMLAIMMGLTTRKWLADRRLYFWGAFLGIAFLFSPDPTGMAPIIVALTMVVLFEGTLLLLRWSDRGRAVFRPRR